MQGGTSPIVDGQLRSIASLNCYPTTCVPPIQVVHGRSNVTICDNSHGYADTIGTYLANNMKPARWVSSTSFHMSHD